MFKVIKKSSLILASIFTALLPLTAVKTVKADGPNLVLNPSAEVTNSTFDQPLNWTTEKRGTNTSAFSYTTGAANTGTKSLQVTVANFNSGSARWRSDPIAVKPSKKYSVSDFYKSTGRSEIDIEYVSTAGTTSTVVLSTVATTNNWTKTTQTFTTPANVKTVTIIHSLTRNGTLQTDDYSLNEVIPVVAAPTVSFSSPLSNTTVSGTRTITAATTSTVGVQFMLDGVNMGAEDTTSPFSIAWDTTQASNGLHALTALARNSAGVTASTSINVNVQNIVIAPTPPTVTITAPANGATVSGAGQAISANASGVQAIAGVQFKVDGVNLGVEDLVAPYFANLDTTTLTNGIHTVTATARNTSNLTSTASISVNVQNSTVVLPPVVNLIANPSTETANLNLPTSWTNGSWGANTHLFTYEATGHTGTHSVKTQMTSFTSGDAKWFFTPVTVEAGKAYEYSHFYQTSVTTDVVAQFTDANGVDTYRWLNTLAPSPTAWQQFSASITMPAGTVKMTVLHIIYSVGFVQIDDANLSLPVVTPPPTTSTILNSSLETAAGNPLSPTNWQKSNWGTNTTTYQYMNEGHTGTQSAKVTVSNYVDGDAKWYFDPVTSLQRGGQYRFSTWYKTNTIPHAVAVFTLDDGSTKYFGMPNPQPDGTANWQYYTDTFQVPANAKDVTVFFFMPNNGWVQIDDQSTVPYQPVGFNRPLMTLTFDDGHEDNITNALPLLNQYGFKTTQCFATGFIEGVTGGPQNVMAFYNSGHEICSHTITHPAMTTISSTQLTNELVHSQQYLESLTGAPVRDFASPYGDYNAAVNTEIKKYYRSHRTVDEGFNSKDNFDIYRLRVQNMTPTTTLAEYQSWIDQAKVNNTWLIIVYHRIATTVPDAFDTLKADFSGQLQAIANSGITVKTYSDALDEVTTQL